MITVSIYDKKLITDDNAISDGVKFETVKFIFPEKWLKYKKTAVFKGENGKCINVVLDRENQLCLSENECYIPHEMLKGEYFFISVFGTLDDSLATTTKEKIEVFKSGYAEGEAPKDPTPSEYQQLISLAESTKKIAESVRNDADNGVFKGEKGDKGDKGDSSDLDVEYLNQNYAGVIKNTAMGTALAIKDAANFTQPLKFNLSSDEVSDFSGITVKVYGKNIINSEGQVYFSKYNGAVYTMSAVGLRGKYLSMQAMADFTNTIEDTATVNCSIQFLDINGTQVTRNWSVSVDKNSSSKITALTMLVPEAAYEVKFHLSVFFNGAGAAQSGSSIAVKNLMIELGNRVTEYQKYTSPKVIYPKENGECDEIFSNVSDITVLTDAVDEKIIIKCDYIADTKKYIDNKLNELSAISLE